ncbi:hypothetical protein E2C01_042524 [Portunus trituberculatus]|uniref:Uncharacterized protein n=1 Tax=Portunus trituberculatus TaxID=210409 RepID=A0A5B7FMM5_PORTR|nr:hypothetical protein [Portunus trituberculatus]
MSLDVTAAVLSHLRSCGVGLASSVCPIVGRPCKGESGVPQGSSSQRRKSHSPSHALPSLALVAAAAHPCLFSSLKL